MRCIHKTKENLQCKAYSISGREFCFTHDPQMADRRKIAVQKGGLSPKKKRSVMAINRIRMKNPEDMIILLEDTVNRVRTGSMAPQQANVVGSLVSLAIKAFEISESI